MCGIAGFIGSGDRDVLQRMTRRLAHRGPDGEGLWTEREVFLGNRRLEIVDIAGGAQPMASADGNLVITFNGEIYNAPELRRELEAAGHIFRSDQSDTEVLIAAYAEWGENMVDRLNGMWAFAIYDRAKRRLFASRDRFGEKPFYYHYAVGGGLFAFASELTALLQHPDVPRNVSPIALRKFFAWNHVPAPLSMIEGVAKLPGGHSLSYDINSRQLRTWRYWHYQPDAVEGGTVEQKCEELREILSRSVQRRMLADVSVGLWLSGGIDSSFVAALAAGIPGGNSMPAFTVGFEDASFDETSHAARVARQLGLDHHTETLTRDRALEILPQLLGKLDEPNGDASLLPTYLLSELTRRHVKVALSGEGGDELFAGYAMFKGQALANRARQLLPSSLHPALVALADRLPVSHRYMGAEFAAKRLTRAIAQAPDLQLPVMMAGIDQANLSDLLQEKISLEEIYSEAIAAWEQDEGYGQLDKATSFFIRFYLQENVLAKVDRASMLHGLEVRCPFLDIEVVDFCRRLPAKFKLHGGQSKFLLKQAARGLLPPEIISRPKKGFGVPLGEWFRDGTLKVDSRILPSPAAATRLSAEHRAGKKNHRMFLWNALVYSVWKTTVPHRAPEISRKTSTGSGEKIMASAADFSSP
jgi:asparagine synthase (glutamine-hydrolysing)